MLTVTVGVAGASIGAAANDYPVFLLAGLLPWNLFSASTSQGAVSVIMNANLVKKVYFPREILPLATIGVALVDFVLQSLVFFAVLLALPLHPRVFTPLSEKLLRPFGAKPLQPATALQLVSVTPAAGAKGVNGTSSVRVRFSQPLAPNSPMPTLSPSIAGHWAVQGNTAVFTPAVGWMQKTKVTVKIPGGLAGVVSAEGATAGDGGTLGSDLSRSFTTGSFSNMRLQELMAQLGYLPMTWKATSGPAIGAANARAQLAAAYRSKHGVAKDERASLAASVYECLGRKMAEAIRIALR